MSIDPRALRRTVGHHVEAGIADDWYGRVYSGPKVNIDHTFMSTVGTTGRPWRRR
jgi:hypothetical protein